MNRRKLLIALAAAGVFATGFGAAVLPASADMRTFVVTLLGGKTVTVTIDVPPGTPVDQITIPGITTPIVGIQEITPPPTATPGASVQLTPTPEPSATPAPTQSGSPSSSAQPEATDKQSQPAKKHRKTGPRGDTQDLVSIVKESEGKPKASKDRNVDGTPTIDNPTFTLAEPGAAPIGVPNFFIDKFRIPPFLLPIYQAAGIEYGVRWEVLAAINEIETDYGRNLNVSKAGAVGWMQFLPSSWKRWGVDANHDGVKDPYNPVDAIFGAARYLKAAGADTDLAKAIFAYNHAQWYVDSVILRAKLLGGLPSNFIGSLTGLTEGHFPVHARATYADDLTEQQIADRKAKGKGNPAWLINANQGRKGINIYAHAGAPVIAVNDGRIVRIGQTARLGRFVQLQDVYGNTYTYGHLKKVSKLYPAPKREKVTKRQIADELKLPKTDPAPVAPASAGQAAPATATSQLSAASKIAAPAAPATSGAHVTMTFSRKPAAPAKERLFANPFRPHSTVAGGAQQALEGKAPKAGMEVFKSTFGRVFGIRTRARDVVLKPLKPGSRVVAGTILGRIGTVEPNVAPHLLFEIRPAGRGAPRVDPKPILDGWKLLESTAIYRAAGKNPFSGPDAKAPTIGQILLMSKESLERQVLADPRVDIYDCGRRDIRLGIIDRRVLATLEFLSASGFRPTVTALECGHSYLTKSGNVSEHSSGNAVDIAQINGIPILGHQGPGSIADMVIQRLLTLQGLMKPHQIISLMTFKDADNTLALPDHADHIHVGFQPMYGTNSRAAKQVNAILKPKQWIKLIDRLEQIDNPKVRLQPSKYAIKVTTAARSGHKGD